MNKPRVRLRCLLTAVIIVTLTACGGGGGAVDPQAAIPAPVNTTPQPIVPIVASATPLARAEVTSGTEDDYLRVTQACTLMVSDTPIALGDYGNRTSTRYATPHNGIDCQSLRFAAFRNLPAYLTAYLPSNASLPQSSAPSNLPAEKTTFKTPKGGRVILANNVSADPKCSPSDAAKLLAAGNPLVIYNEDTGISQIFLHSISVVSQRFHIRTS